MTKRVLVVEDQEDLRGVLRDLFTSSGYIVIEAANADEALTVLRQDNISINIVLTDVDMPGSMDGFALATWIRQNNRNLFVRSDNCSLALQNKSLERSLM